MKNTQLIVSLVLMAALLAFVIPRPGEASLIFSPFGGKVQTPPLPASSCLSILSPINASIAAAALALASIGIPTPYPQLEIDQLSISSTDNSTENLGIFKTQWWIPPGVPTGITNTVLPLITYRYYNYSTPNVWVLGTSVNVCDICNATKKVPGASSICKAIPYVDKICGAIADTSCPITNLIYQIGTGLIPDTGQKGLGNAK